jgi:threonine dehydratase
MFPSDWITSAAGRIAPHIVTTPLTFDAKRNIYFKWENQQITGSFKVRGALNKVLSLEKWEQQQGMVAASAGNHGQGVALAAKLIGAPVVVFTSKFASPLKIEKMRALGAGVRFVPGGYELAEITGIRHAAENGETWVSPYNDSQIVAGQGTIGLEIFRQMQLTPEMTLLVPVSGGGLLAGIAAALAKMPVRPRIIGVQAAASPFMHAVFTRNSQEGVPDLPSLADGLTGAVEEGSITIPIVKSLVDDILLVEENDIAHAVAFAYHEYGQVIEGSAAVGLAAILTGAVKPPVLVVVSGGNIQPEIHARLCENQAREKR